MKIQFQGGGEVRDRIRLDDPLELPHFYAVVRLNEEFADRGAFEARTHKRGEDDASAPNILIEFNPDWTNPPLTDYEVWRFLADLVNPEIEEAAH